MDTTTPVVTAKQLFVIVNLDKNLIYVQPDAGTGLSYEFEINPFDFIHYAELDLQENTQRGLINCLSNSKRAIDAEVSKVLNCFGLSSKRKNFLQKMDMFKQLGMITPRILSKVVQRRNFLEHEYKAPDKEQVEDALDVANLFILTMESVLDGFVTYFSICNDFSKDHEAYNPKAKYGENVEKEIYVEFDEENKWIELHGYIFDKDSLTKWNDRTFIYAGQSRVYPKDPCFTRLLALAYRSYRREQENIALYECLLDSLMT